MCSEELTIKTTARWSLVLGHSLVIGIWDLVIPDHPGLRSAALRPDPARQVSARCGHALRQAGTVLQLTPHELSPLEEGHPERPPCRSSRRRPQGRDAHLL